MNKNSHSTLVTTIQNSNVTSINRYPSIFQELNEIVNKKFNGSAKILSFGCSTGEEVQTLDEIYLVNCRIVGVDISEQCIRIAKNNIIGKRNIVDFYSSATFSAAERFDIVIALSVLCKWPDTQGKLQINDHFPFDEFNKICFELSKLVSDGGYLILHNTNYFFEDSSSFRNFKVGSSFDNIGFVERFDIQGNKQINARKGYVIFQKCPASCIDDTDNLVIKN